MFEEPLPQESPEEKHARFADGRISEEEIKSHWSDPSSPLFEHELVRKETKTRFRVRALTEELKEPLLQEVKSAWQDTDYESMRIILDKFFEQKRLNHPGLLNVEYYVATDTENRPFAITGIYTVDIMGGAGFATKNKLDSSKHYLATGLGWFSVSKQYQGAGLGGFLLDWTEKMAKNRGAKFMFIETDDSENEENARKLYEKRGYRQGFAIDNYFGPGRDKSTHYLNFSEEEDVEAVKPEERVDDENKKEVLELARKIYSPDRFKEFKVCLDLFLQQKEGEKSIIPPESMVVRGNDGEVESFSIFRAGPLYANAVISFWHGVDVSKPDAEKRFRQSMGGILKEAEREILVVIGEGKNTGLSKLGFKSAEGGVPYTYEEGDDTRFLLYTKRLI